MYGRTRGTGRRAAGYNSVSRQPMELGHHEIDLARPTAPTSSTDDVYRIYGPRVVGNERVRSRFLRSTPWVHVSSRRDGLTGDRLVAATISKFSVSSKQQAIELKHLDLISKGDCEDLMARRDEGRFSGR